DHAFFHLEDTEEGLIAETLVFNHCKKHIWEDVFYWKDTKGNEVDIVILRNKTLLPIEVKFKSRIDKKELKGLLSFMDKYKCKNGIVVTKNSLDSIESEGKEIRMMPIWLFLLANPS
ncbi:MAG: DUF4143 domain-containing protein, partial [Candidatus Methanoperedens sp.]|nr:DUF4143 domain-containing protein [Candidatus Methanoperedens sp.]